MKNLSKSNFFMPMIFSVVLVSCNPGGEGGITDPNGTNGKNLGLDRQYIGTWETACEANNSEMRNLGEDLIGSDFKKEVVIISETDIKHFIKYYINSESQCDENKLKGEFFYRYEYFKNESEADKWYLKTKAFTYKPLNDGHVTLLNSNNFAYPFCQFNSPYTWVKDKAKDILTPEGVDTVCNIYDVVEKTDEKGDPLKDNNGNLQYVVSSKPLTVRMDDLESVSIEEVDITNDGKIHVGKVVTGDGELIKVSN